MAYWDRLYRAFGRLAWSERHQAKWAHASPDTARLSDGWNFFFTEISAPSLPASWRERVPPDVFAVLTNEGVVHTSSPLMFNPVFFLSIGADLPDEVLRLAEAAVSGCSSLVRAQLVATITRPWGYAFGSGFTGAIQDMAHTGLFRAGQRHDRPLDLQAFSESWQPFQPAH